MLGSRRLVTEKAMDVTVNILNKDIYDYGVRTGKERNKNGK